MQKVNEGEKKQIKRIYISEYGAKLFGKKLILDNTRMETKKMNTLESLVPIAMDEDENLYVPIESVPPEEYDSMYKTLKTLDAYYTLRAAVLNGVSTLELLARGTIRE